MNDWILHLINGGASESGTLDAAMKLAANDLIYMALPLAGLLWFSPLRQHERSQHQRIVATLIVAGVAAIFVSWSFGQFFTESRPFVTDTRTTVLVSHAANNSFASDHAAAAFAIAGALVWTRKSAGAFVLSIIALACVFVGIHWPVDVLAGALIAFVSGSIARLAAPSLIRPQSRLAKHVPAILLKSPERL